MNLIDEVKNILMSKRIFIVLLLFLFIGVMLIVFSNHYNTHEETNEEKPNIISENTDEKNKYERELEEILAQIKGVGDVKVMIVYGSTERKILEKDKDSHGNEKTVTKNQSSNTEPFVVMTKSPDISGVIVAAKGGGNVTVKNLISDCISEVLEVPVHKVKILEMK